MKSFLITTNEATGSNAAFRRSVAKAIPHFQQLIDDPAEYLGSREVRIGPCIRWISGTVCGVVIGFVLFDCFCFMTGSWDRWSVMVCCQLIASAIFLYRWRGGRIVVRRSSVEFRLRSCSVVCPWSLFAAPESIERIDDRTLAVAVNADAIEEVKLYVGGVEQSRGLDIDALQFQFLPMDRNSNTDICELPEVALRDLYKAKLNEIASLLLFLERELGQASKSTNINSTGA